MDEVLVWLNRAVVNYKEAIEALKDIEFEESFTYSNIPEALLDSERATTSEECQSIMSDVESELKAALEEIEEYIALATKS